MDLSVVSCILKELVPFHSQISLPGLGCFVVDEKPSQIINQGTVITPPQKKLRFSFSIGNNDRLIENEYAKIKNENAHDAKLSVEKLIREIKEQLTQNRKVKLPLLGELKFNENGELLFIPSNDISIFPTASQPSVVNIVPKESIEFATAPIEIPSAPEFDNLQMQRILDYALKASVISKSCRDGIAAIQAKELEETPLHKPADAQKIKEPTDTHVQNSEIKAESEANIDVKDELKESGEAVQDIVKANEQTVEVAANVKSATEKKDNKLSTEIESSEPKVSKKQLWLAIVLIVIIIIILLLTIVFVMQDELRPFLEKILYNAKERALIHHFNI